MLIQVFQQHSRVYIVHRTQRTEQQVMYMVKVYYTCVHVCVYIYLYLNVGICIYACIYIYTFIYTYVNIGIYMCVYTYMSMYAYMRYICLHVYTHICMYIIAVEKRAMYSKQFNLIGNGQIWFLPSVSGKVITKYQDSYKCFSFPAFAKLFQII